MNKRIFYYAHHHGRGHISRASAICRHTSNPVTVFTSADPVGVFDKMDHVNVVNLQLDVGEPKNENLKVIDTPSHLHYAPAGVNGLRNRMTRISYYISINTPAVFIVDISSEVTQLARLMGVPVVTYKCHGIREDLPHRIAYDSSFKILAPYPETMEQVGVDNWIKRKIHYTGGFSRYDGRKLTKEERFSATSFDDNDTNIVVLSGGNAGFATCDQIYEAALIKPEWEWHIIGNHDIPSNEIPENVDHVGWVNDTLPYLLSADAIISSCGYNTVMEAAYVNKPFIGFPEERPYDEQLERAKILESINAATIMYEWPDDPADVVRSIDKSIYYFDDSIWKTINDGKGSVRAAKFIDDLAEQFKWNFLI